MNDLAVSVVIPTYNRAHLVGRAIRNAIACTTGADEILVVDDASTDDTESLVRSFGDRVRFLPGPHGGAGFTRNRGVRAATKPLVAFLDSDDEWMPDKIALQRTFLQRRPDVLFCFSNFIAKDENGEEPGYLIHWHNDPRPWDEILAPGAPYSTIAPLPGGREDFSVHCGNMFLQMMLSDYVATTTVMVRREEAGDALLGAEDIPIGEDLACFAKLAQKGTAAYFDCNLSYQWGHVGSRVSDGYGDKLARARIKLMERIWATDADFMAQHQATYRRKLRELHLTVARSQIARGQSAEARDSLRHAGHGPWHYHFLASLPGSLTRGLLGLRRVLRGG